MHFIYSKSLFLSVILAQLAYAQVNLFNLSLATAGLSTICIEVINQDVNCDPSIMWAGLNGKLETDATLARVCTSNCTSGLAVWQRRVNGACGTQRFQSRDGFMVLPQYLSEMYLERYNQLCLVNSAGKFCNAVIRSLAGVNPTNQLQTASPVPRMACNDCVLRLAQTQLEMPISSDPQRASLFTSLTSSCSVSNYSVATATTAPLQYLIPVTTTTTGRSMASATLAGCSGSTYAIKPGDTCESISASQGISTLSLLTTNSLQGYCRNFPSRGNLCILGASKCTVYAVKANDTCSSIAASNSLFWAQIVSWNPELSPACTNLTATHLGWSICISNPGGSWLDPSPSTPTSITSAPNTLFTMPLKPFSSYSFTQVTASGVTNASIGQYNLTGPYSTPYANGTRLDCPIYVTGSSLQNSTSNTTVTSCDQVAAGYGVQLSDFLAWNPSLNSSSSYSPCVLDPNLQYCARTYLANATNFTSYCVQVETARPGQDCTDFTTTYGAPLEGFQDWNPSVTVNANLTGCTGFVTGLQYCVAVAHFRQPGIVSICNEFIMVNNTQFTVSPLDPCTAIETEYGLSHARFVAWNPAVGTDCLGISPMYDYCVSIPGYKPTYSTTSAYVASTAAAGTPARATST